jgi:hypothetical protein
MLRLVQCLGIDVAPCVEHSLLVTYLHHVLGPVNTWMLVAVFLWILTLIQDEAAQIYLQPHAQPVGGAHETMSVVLLRFLCEIRYLPHQAGHCWTQ